MDAVTLNPYRVTEIYTDCLFRDGEDTTSHVKAEGIMATAGFHPERLAGHKAEIEALLGELPDEFKNSGGGGGSFLNACMDKRGQLWTGLHQVVDQLLQLGLAIGKIEYCLPRELWSIFPGGMPYFVIK